MDFFEEYFDKVHTKIKKATVGNLEQGVKLISSAAEAGGKIILAGNGASAAMASHVAVDLTKNAKVRAVTFNEVDLITCFANDYGYEKWAEKCIEFYADKNDIAILISSSGKSKNIVNAALKAKELRLKVITLSGFGENNPLRQIGDINLWVDSKEYNIVEITHITWLLAIIDKIINNKKLLVPHDIGNDFNIF